MTKRSTLGLLAAGLTLAAFVGCAMQRIDIVDDTFIMPLGGVGGATSAASTSGTGGATTAASTGGAGGALVCTPSATQPCYDGPAGTQGVGICKAGTQTCAANGMSWGPCVGEVLPQVENCATPIDENCDGMAPACKGDLDWALRFGDVTNQYVTSIATDSAGNVIVTGYFTGTINFGGAPLVSAGALDAFVAKLDPSGNPLWSRRFGMTGASEPASVAVDNAGNVILAGKLSGTVDFGGGTLTNTGSFNGFVTKLDASGHYLWAKRFGDATTAEAVGVAVDGKGNVIVTGDFAGAVDLGGGALTSAGSLDVFVAKLGAGGNHLWSKRYGDAAGQDGAGVAVDGTGNVIVTGSFSGSVDFGGGALISAGGGDVFVAKLDTAGNHAWSRRFGDASGQTSAGVAVDSAGGVVVTGSFSGSVDFGGGALTSAGGLDIFVAKLDAGGAYVWSKRYGDATGQSGAAVAVDSTDNVLVTGSFHGTVGFGGGLLPSGGSADVFIVKLDAGGGHLWSRRAGDAQDQNGTSIAADASGNALVAGDFFGSVDFGAGPLTSAGGADVFLAKFGP